MFSHLDDVEKKYEELDLKLVDPAVLSSQSEVHKYAKEHSDLSPLVDCYREYKKVLKEIEENKELLFSSSDDEFKELAKEELRILEENKEKLENQLKILLLPKDPNDERNVILEIRAGTGGEEAALFASVLFKMYTKYAEKRRWKFEVLSSNFTGLGGIKEIIVLIEGRGAYSRLKYESGTHRVQRVPETEAQGRIHTSAVTVAVLPEAEEVEVDINPQDLEIDICRAGGAGGQHVNTTDSAIRIVHIPTGLVVSCQDERSQHKNKAKALKILKARLLDVEKRKQHEEIAKNRKIQVGSGDRSERIRTFNFPQGRVTDHRIGLTLYRIDAILEGEIDEIIDSLITYYQAEALKGDGV